MVLPSPAIRQVELSHQRLEQRQFVEHVSIVADRSRGDTEITRGKRLLPAQELNEWRDIKEVNDSIAINICLGLKRLSRQSVDEWCDIKEVYSTIQVDIPQHCHYRPLTKAYVIDTDFVALNTESSQININHQDACKQSWGKVEVVVASAGNHR